MGETEREPGQIDETELEPEYMDENEIQPEPIIIYSDDEDDSEYESDSDFDSDSEYEYELDECIVTDKSIQHWDGSAKTLMHFKNLCNIKKSPQEMNSIRNRYQYKYDRSKKKLVKICDCDTDNNEIEKIGYKKVRKKHYKNKTL